MDLNISRSRSYCDLLDCLDLDLPPKENVLKNSRIDMIVYLLIFNFFRGVFFSFLDMEGSFESQCNFEFLSEKPSHTHISTLFHRRMVVRTAFENRHADS